jgi:phosphoadenosine phosphosulfate reductase
LLAGKKAWVTGLREAQAATRGGLQTKAYDQANDLVKFSPLANWSEREVWVYLRAHQVPYNKLHDQNYPSIGCAPCTRAVQAGEDVRAGRWWWETPEQKECGLHVVDGKVQRVAAVGAPEASIRSGAGETAAGVAA